MIMQISHDELVQALDEWLRCRGVKLTNPADQIEVCLVRSTGERVNVVGVDVVIDIHEVTLPISTDPYR